MIASPSCSLAFPEWIPARADRPTATRSKRRPASAGSTASANATTLSNYTVHFSPRNAASIWGVISTARMQKLIKLGRMHASGMMMYAQREKAKSKRYSYEVGNCTFTSIFELQFRSSPTAWELYQSQAPWYRRVLCDRVMNAKKEETRRRRLNQLIADPAHQRRIK